MKAATVSEIKKELKFRSTEQLMELCLRLARFKKENKELLTYLLFESDDEEAFIRSIKSEMDEQFETINTNSYFYIKKSVRKILRNVKKYIRYSPLKETEVELLLYFCNKLKDLNPSIKRNVTLLNLYNRQLDFISKKITALHEDLQYDYNKELEDLAF
ncbi:hypothetical protein [Ulvibacter antarcticus]|uniref:Uncharacterized protein n=1 Tax=Ulvibacter antarcticus TaxID=442714 RepID=A0A3L9YUY8_9FLAO|nr:hypothetical protein [Ulvibacter antarcticus]RMA64561.1 hypothetical protein BXY75_1437 [Ulvibacter antarcticus]